MSVKITVYDRRDLFSTLFELRKRVLSGDLTMDEVKEMVFISNGSENVGFLATDYDDPTVYFDYKRSPDLLEYVVTNNLNTVNLASANNSGTSNIFSIKGSFFDLPDAFRIIKSREFIFNSILLSYDIPTVVEGILDVDPSIMFRYYNFYNIINTPIVGIEYTHNECIKNKWFNREYGLLGNLGYMRLTSLIVSKDDNRKIIVGETLDLNDDFIEQLGDRLVYRKDLEVGHKVIIELKDDKL